MARQYKCYGTCEGKYDKENLIEFKKKNYCLPCYEAKVKEQNDRSKLYTLINETFNISFPTGLMLRQIKEYSEQRGYSLNNIFTCLYYIINVKKIPLQSKYGIALVPQFYEEHIEYYKALKSRRDKMKEMDLNEKKQIIVRLSQPIINDDYRRKKLINMEELLK